MPQLYWLGADYTSTVVAELLAGLRRQDAETELIAVRCESPPDLEARVRDGGVITGQRAEFDLQVLVRDGNGDHWRLRGVMTCTGDRLDTGEPTLHTAFDLASSEAV